MRGPCLGLQHVAPGASSDSTAFSYCCDVGPVDLGVVHQFAGRATARQRGLMCQITYLTRSSNAWPAATITS
jgi:hypothetical protein